MGSKIPFNVIIDTCFWYALFDKREEYHTEATSTFSYIDEAKILIPWPCLYETINTRFIKNQNSIDQFQRILNQPNVEKIDDAPYKENALAKTFILSVYKKRNISLVDMIIRFILLDTSYKINYLVTFNQKDFNDVCRDRKIGIFP